MSCCGRGGEKDLLFENLIVLRRVLEIALERRFQLHMERRGPVVSGEPGTEEKRAQRGGKDWENASAREVFGGRSGLEQI